MDAAGFGLYPCVLEGSMLPLSFLPSRRAFLGGFFAASLVPPRPGRATLPAVGPVAPEFTGIEAWLNTDVPLSLAMLRGKVVLVDFWTYSCINCRRTVPCLNRWQAEYGQHGLQIIGIHTPEFSFERLHRNVEDAVREFGIRFPVAQDNRFGTWRAWGNSAWPAFYLLDRDGRIALVRHGEGHAREMESAIRGLLGLPAGARGRSRDDPDLSRIRSPEIYFGAMHPTPQDRGQSPQRGLATYGFGTSAGPRLNTYQLDGTWEREQEALVLRSSRGRVRLRFSAAKLHIVAGAEEPTTIRVRVDGTPVRTLEVSRPSLYTLVDGDTYAEQLVEFETDTPGLSLFSATFG